MNFYHKYIYLDSIFIEIEKLEISPKEKKELCDLIDAQFHNNILNLILDNLSIQDKQIFLNHLKSNDHSKIWNLLNDKIEGIEQKIIDTAKLLELELQQDLKQAHKIKKIGEHKK